MHPEDLVSMGIEAGALVTVSSRRGSITLSVRPSLRIGRGSVFIPFHFREAAANALTDDRLDPFGKIPGFKFSAVKVERAMSS